MSAAAPVLRSGAPERTEAIGAAVGAVLRPGDLLFLEGALGAGKTCLVRGLVAGAGGDPRLVRSPTFVLHQPHRCPGLTLHHLDLYRLGPGCSLEALDLEGALIEGAAAVEWGSFGDLRGIPGARPFTVAIDQGAAEERLLSLRGQPPSHVADAWLGLSRQGQP